MAIQSFLSFFRTTEQSSHVQIDSEQSEADYAPTYENAYDSDHESDDASDSDYETTDEDASDSETESDDASDSDYEPSDEDASDSETESDDASDSDYEPSDEDASDSEIESDDASDSDFDPTDEDASDSETDSDQESVCNNSTFERHLDVENSEFANRIENGWIPCMGYISTAAVHNYIDHIERSMKIVTNQQKYSHFDNVPVSKTWMYETFMHHVPQFTQPPNDDYHETSL